MNLIRQVRASDEVTEMYMFRSAVFLSLCLLWAQISTVQAGTHCIPGSDPTIETTIYDTTSGGESEDGTGSGETPAPVPEPEPDCE